MLSFVSQMTGSVCTGDDLSTVSCSLRENPSRSVVGVFVIQVSVSGRSQGEVD